MGQSTPRSSGAPWRQKIAVGRGGSLEAGGNSDILWWDHCGHLTDLHTCDDAVAHAKERAHHAILVAQAAAAQTDIVAREHQLEKRVHERRPQRAASAERRAAGSVCWRCGRSDADIFGQPCRCADGPLCQICSNAGVDVHGKPCTCSYGRERMSVSPNLRHAVCRTCGDTGFIVFGRPCACPRGREHLYANVDSYVCKNCSNTGVDFLGKPCTCPKGLERMHREQVSSICPYCNNTGIDVLGRSCSCAYGRDSTQAVHAATTTCRNCMNTGISFTGERCSCAYGQTRDQDQPVASLWPKHHNSGEDVVARPYACARGDRLHVHAKAATNGCRKCSNTGVDFAGEQCTCAYGHASVIAQGSVCRSCGNTGVDMFGRHCVCAFGKAAAARSGAALKAVAYAADMTSRATQVTAAHGCARESPRAAQGDSANTSPRAFVLSTRTSPRATHVFDSDVVEALVLVGPVIGEVTATTAKVLLEVDHDIFLTCHAVPMRQDKAPVHGNKATASSGRHFKREEPGIFIVQGLQPETTYHLTFTPLAAPQMEELFDRGCFVRTLPRPGQMKCLRILAVSSAGSSKAVDVTEACKTCDLVLHLGSQENDCTSAAMHDIDLMERPGATLSVRAGLQRRALRQLQESYRTAWSHAPLAAALARASHLWTRGHHDLSHRTALGAPEIHRWSVSMMERVQRMYEGELWESGASECAADAGGVTARSEATAPHNFHIIGPCGVFPLDARYGSEVLLQDAAHGEGPEFLGQGRRDDLLVAFGTRGLRCVVVVMEWPLLMSADTNLHAPNMPKMHQQLLWFLDLCYTWKASAMGREVVLLAGGTDVSVETCIHDSKTGQTIRQFATGSRMNQASKLSCALNGRVGERFEYTHKPVLELVGSGLLGIDVHFEKEAVRIEVAVGALTPHAGKAIHNGADALVSRADQANSLPAGMNSSFRSGQRINTAIRASRKPMESKAAKCVRKEPRSIDWGKAIGSKWKFPTIKYGGGHSYTTEPEREEIHGLISKGLALVTAEPAKYDGMFFQSDMVNWPLDQQRYTLVRRTGSGFCVEAQPWGHFTWVPAMYQALTPNVEVDADRYTDTMHHRGYALGRPIMPGRAQGCADVPGLQLIGEVDPNDIAQGGVGDCWLLSAISALAEFHDAIARLFCHTEGVTSRPHDAFNTYTVALYDLTSWERVKVVVDERLCTKPDGRGVLGCSPAVNGELWACYLEKAVAAHCGGWDNIEGGQPTHAWRLLTGCKHQYTIMSKGHGFQCFGDLNPNTGEWEKQANSPKYSFQGLWPMPWPEVGGGGDLSLAISEHDLFERMCAWDDQNYVMCAGTRSGNLERDGILDGHAYTVIACMSNVGGTNIDLIKIRNPWHKGEFMSGMWADNGPGWRQYPQVKTACKPVQADDGIFWMSAEEFFSYYKKVYLCAHDISLFARGSDVAAR